MSLTMDNGKFNDRRMCLLKGIAGKIYHNLMQKILKNLTKYITAVQLEISEN